MEIVRKAKADVVIFFETGEGILGAEVTLFENGIVHVLTPFEESHSHISNCEIFWVIRQGSAVGEDNVRKLNVVKKPEGDEGPEAS